MYVIKSSPLNMTLLFYSHHLSITDPFFYFFIYPQRPKIKLTYLHIVRDFSLTLNSS